MIEKPLSIRSYGYEIDIKAQQPCVLIGDKLTVQKKDEASLHVLTPQGVRRYCRLWENWEKSLDKEYLELRLSRQFSPVTQEGRVLFRIKPLRKSR
jgi:hypothetical protein